MFLDFCIKYILTSVYIMLFFCKLSWELFPLVNRITHCHDVALVRNQIISTTESEWQAIRSLSAFDPLAIIETHEVRTAWNGHWLRGWVRQVEPLPDADTDLCIWSFQHHCCHGNWQASKLHRSYSSLELKQMKEGNAILLWMENNGLIIAMKCKATKYKKQIIIFFKMC